MKLFQRIILFVAAVTFFVLLWKIQIGEIWAHLSQIKWGILLIVGQEVVAHVFNALGWRYAFHPRKLGTYPFSELFKLRIAGDGVNYLTPSGTIAGEFIRAELLNNSQSVETRYSSVAIAKFSQSLGQVVFILLGFIFVVGKATTAIQGHPALIHNTRMTLSSILAFFVLYGIWTWHSAPLEPQSGGAQITEVPDDQVSFREVIAAVPRQCRQYFRLYPARFLLSIGWFMAGYAWGGFEAFWICRFLGIPVSPLTAMAIEALSNLVDIMFFMIPAKVGTQEAGKTAIFAALGLPPSAGFAFGLIRHFRELSWAGFGLLLCRKQRRDKDISDRPLLSSPPPGTIVPRKGEGLVPFQ